MDSCVWEIVRSVKTPIKELIEQMSHFEQLMTLYFPLFSKTYEWNKRGLKSMSYGLTKVPNAVIIAVLNEKTR